MIGRFEQVREGGRFTWRTTILIKRNGTRGYRVGDGQEFWFRPGDRIESEDWIADRPGPVNPQRLTTI